MSIPISFHTADKSIRFTNRTVLKTYIEKQIKKEGFVVECLQFIFCSDQYLLNINNEFLKHDFFTDIISFDLSEKKGCLIGDIYISVDRVKENAKTHLTTQHQELLRVIFHGALHLCGYKDKKPIDTKLMRLMEDRWLKGYLKLIGH